jgi:hypothetical protein
MYQINALNPKDEGHHTRKRFGQNFLHDQRVIAKIVRSVHHVQVIILSKLAQVWQHYLTVDW